MWFRSDLCVLPVRMLVTLWSRVNFSSSRLCWLKCLGPYNVQKKGNLSIYCCKTAWHTSSAFNHLIRSKAPKQLDKNKLTKIVFSKLLAGLKIADKQINLSAQSVKHHKYPACLGDWTHSRYI